MLFTKKYKITFILKSGVKVTFKCNDFKIYKSGNTITGYEIEGGDGSVFYARLDEISAILKE